MITNTISVEVSCNGEGIRVTHRLSYPKPTFAYFQKFQTVYRPCLSSRRPHFCFGTLSVVGFKNSLGELLPHTAR